MILLHTTSMFPVHLSSLVLKVLTPICRPARNSVWYGALRSYGWVRGLKFRVLYRHPVVTSARTKGGMATIVVSYLVAFVLFPINALLPKHLCIRGGWTLLDYWYGHRN